MRIVVTGATGFVAGMLIPRLIARGADVLLVSREPSILADRFPACARSDYASLSETARGHDVLVNLATRNNDQGGDRRSFEDANVTQLLATYRQATRAGIARFVDVSTIHALDDGDRRPYASSKRAGTAVLSTQTGAAVETVYLAAVHGDHWSGRLAPLARLPRRLSKPIFLTLAAIKPTVDIERLVDHLMHSPGVPETVLTDGQARNPVYGLVSRALSIGAGIAILLLFCWLLAGIWIAVRLDSAGPGFFAQRRLGLDAHPFTCLKFRTMVTGTQHRGTHEVSAASITRLGRWLRRSKLDELPQAWNLLRGEMNLIGPRPGLPSQTALAQARARRGIFGILPGISGLAQVNGIDMSDPERLARWDARYLALQCLMLDFRLMIATVSGRGRGDPAQP